ncbi:MAG: ABC transporter permease subunit [Candidatus Micrarchaeota archaeon]
MVTLSWKKYGWLAVLFVSLVIWEIAALMGYGASISSPLRALKTLFFLAAMPKFLFVAFQSYVNVLAGIALALVFAVPLAVWAGLREKTDSAVTPNVMLLGALPDLALLPLLVLWFGAGNFAAIIMSAICAFFPIYFSVRDGVLGIPKELFEAAEIMGARGFTLYREVVVEGAWASMITGTRIAFQYIWEIIIAIEIAANVLGIGSFISVSVDPAHCVGEAHALCGLLRSAHPDIDYAFASIIMVGLFVLFTDRVVFESLEKKVKIWRGK